MTSAEIVEKIKRVLLDPEGTTQGVLAKLAAEYALHCRRLNANVERANSTFRSGALSESERILDEYSVFEEFRFLNFDGKEDWRSVCRTLGFEIAILPPIQTIEELRAFADAYERTRSLFAEQRRLALEGGSNARRLQILYTLESIFPQYVFWKTPIKDLEHERIEEISAQLKVTTRQNVDVAFITGALQELENAQRRSPAPEKLINTLRSWKEYVDKADACKRLKVLLLEWKKARESNDDFQALACLQYFRDQGLSKGTSIITKEELQELETLLQATQKIERREAARVQLKRKSRELSRALETDSNVDRLSDLFASTELESDKAGEALDPSVARAYRQRMESLETQGRRRRLALVLALSLTLVLFGAASALVIKRAQTKRNVDEVVGELTAKLQAYEGTGGINGRVEALEEAEEIIQGYEKKKVDFLQNPDYKQTVDSIKNARTQEDQRLHRFEDAATEILNRHKENFPTPSLLSTLQSLCRTERERKVYLKLKKRDVELKNEENARNADAYAQKLKELVAAKEALEEAQNLTEREITLEISNIRRGLDELKQIQISTNVQEAKSQIKTLETLNAFLDNFEKQIKQTSQEKESQEQDSTPESDFSASSAEPAPAASVTEPDEAATTKTDTNAEDDGALDEVLKMLDE